MLFLAQSVQCQCLLAVCALASQVEDCWNGFGSFRPSSRHRSLIIVYCMLVLVPAITVITGNFLKSHQCVYKLGQKSAPRNFGATIRDRMKWISPERVQWNKNFAAVSM